MECCNTVAVLGQGGMRRDGSADQATKTAVRIGMVIRREVFQVNGRRVCLLFRVKVRSIYWATQSGIMAGTVSKAEHCLSPCVPWWSKSA